METIEKGIKQLVQRTLPPLQLQYSTKPELNIGFALFLANKTGKELTDLPRQKEYRILSTIMSSTKLGNEYKSSDDVAFKILLQL